MTEEIYAKLRSLRGRRGTSCVRLSAGAARWWSPHLRKDGPGGARGGAVASPRSGLPVSPVSPKSRPAVAGRSDRSSGSAAPRRLPAPGSRRRRSGPGASRITPIATGIGGSSAASRVGERAVGLVVARGCRPCRRGRPPGRSRRCAGAGPCAGRAEQQRLAVLDVELRVGLVALLAVKPANTSSL